TRSARSSADVNRGPAARNSAVQSPDTARAMTTNLCVALLTPVFEHAAAYTAAMRSDGSPGFRRSLWQLLVWGLAGALGSVAAYADEPATLLVPARVFDGATMHAGWQVLVSGDRITAAGASMPAPADARRIDLGGMTLLPGLIEGHGHLFLHPYDETSWDDQVLHEPLALRTARAVNHARATLLAGFTTLRDLGTEGAGYADVGLKAAIDQGIVPGPRLLVATRAIVATGAYGPKGFEPEYANDIPQGGEEASGLDQMAQVVRSQIKHGADWVKIYADYRWGPNGENEPTFTLDEL